MRPLGTLIVHEQPCVCPEGNNAGKFGLDKLPLVDPLRIDPQAEKEMHTALYKRNWRQFFFWGGGGIGFSCDCLYLTQHYDNKLVFTAVNLNIR